jgi:hypothetical protein
MTYIQNTHRFRGFKLTFALNDFARSANPMQSNETFALRRVDKQIKRDKIYRCTIHARRGINQIAEYEFATFNTCSIASIVAIDFL